MFASNHIREPGLGTPPASRNESRQYRHPHQHGEVADPSNWHSGALMFLWRHQLESSLRAGLAQDVRAQLEAVRSEGRDLRATVDGLAARQAELVEELALLRPRAASLEDALGGLSADLRRLEEKLSGFCAATSGFEAALEATRGNIHSQVDQRLATEKTQMMNFFSEQAAELRKSMTCLLERDGSEIRALAAENERTRQELHRQEEKLDRQAEQLEILVRERAAAIVPKSFISSKHVTEGTRVTAPAPQPTQGLLDTGPEDTRATPACLYETPPPATPRHYLFERHATSRSFNNRTGRAGSRTFADRILVGESPSAAVQRRRLASGATARATAVRKAECGIFPSLSRETARRPVTRAQTRAKEPVLPVSSAQVVANDGAIKSPRRRTRRNQQAAGPTKAVTSRSRQKPGANVRETDKNLARLSCAFQAEYEQQQQQQQQQQQEEEGVRPQKEHALVNKFLSMAKEFLSADEMGLLLAALGDLTTLTRDGRVAARRGTDWPDVWDRLCGIETIYRDYLETKQA